MKIRPLGKRVLARKVKETEKKTAGGIVLPESVKDDKIVRATVKAIGTDEKISVKVGDEIIVSSFAGTEMELEGEKLILVKYDEILAVIE
ncbi:co-chaperone GroES [Candidatus Acetothermia bacterium]|jgi:chaperonin GroES|nr:co-chaperone GroES [Candidatus Acetothermia bacterium]MCI2426086.1 co-chaperone GroES [Candidatus Acetothermia bacterium]MCI2427082.1 co-chaperone GroES [Candidatus Acetothermia bacterium]MCI2428262.1 co-chaperone GroES [Candidatus Acetothermia bacterium]